MLALDLLQWWYFQGWSRFANSLIAKIKGTFEFFSVGLLLRTLFTPYKQLSAEDHSGKTDPASIAGAAFDNLLSRFIGFFVRVGIIIISIITVCFEAIFGFILIVLWPAVPLLPVIGLLASMTGVVIGIFN